VIPTYDSRWTEIVVRVGLAVWLAAYKIARVARGRR
jgi:hypothetical protein